MSHLLNPDLYLLTFLWCYGIQCPMQWKMGCIVHSFAKKRSLDCCACWWQQRLQLVKVCSINILLLKFMTNCFLCYFRSVSCPQNVSDRWKNLSCLGRCSVLKNDRGSQGAAPPRVYGRHMLRLLDMRSTVNEVYFYILAHFLCWRFHEPQVWCFPSKVLGT